MSGEKIKVVHEEKDADVKMQGTLSSGKHINKLFGETHNF